MKWIPNNTVIPLDWCFYPKYVTVCLTQKSPSDIATLENEKLLTDANNFLDLDTGGVDLFGELTDSLVRVLVGKGVNVYPHSWGKRIRKEREAGGERREEGREQGRTRKKRNQGVKEWRLIHSGNYTPSVLYFHRAAGYTAFLWNLYSSSSFLLSRPCFSSFIAFHVAVADSDEDGAR